MLLVPAPYTTIVLVPTGRAAGSTYLCFCDRPFRDLGLRPMGCEFLRRIELVNAAGERNRLALLLRHDVPIQRLGGRRRRRCSRTTGSCDRPVQRFAMALPARPASDERRAGVRFGR